MTLHVCDLYARTCWDYCKPCLSITSFYGVLGFLYKFQPVWILRYTAPKWNFFGLSFQPFHHLPVFTSTSYECFALSRLMQYAAIFWRTFFFIFDPGICVYKQIKYKSWVLWKKWKHTKIEHGSYCTILYNESSSVTFKQLANWGGSNGYPQSI